MLSYLQSGTLNHDFKASDRTDTMIPSVCWEQPPEKKKRGGNYKEII